MVCSYDESVLADAGAAIRLWYLASQYGSSHAPGSSSSIPACRRAGSLFQDWTDSTSNGSAFQMYWLRSFGGITLVVNVLRLPWSFKKRAPSRWYWRSIRCVFEVFQLILRANRPAPKRRDQNANIAVTSLHSSYYPSFGQESLTALIRSRVRIKGRLQLNGPGPQRPQHRRHVVIPVGFRERHVYRRPKVRAPAA